MKHEMITIDVHIPTADGKSVAYTIPATVPAVFNEELQDYILDGKALEEIDRIKARHMGILLPKEIKALRGRLNITQEQMADLLQIGKKTWSRWETGRERPSRSMNILIRALNDGKIDAAYLRSIAAEKPSWAKIIYFMENMETNENKPLSITNLDENDFCNAEAAIVNGKKEDAA